MAGSPADIIEAFLANKYLKNGKFDERITPHLTERMEEFKYLMIHRNIFDGYARKIKSGDILIFATEKGENELKEIQDKPVKFIKDSINSINKIMTEKDPNNIPHEDQLICYSKKMAPVLKWCIKNGVPPNLDQLTIHTDDNKGQIILENHGFSIVCSKSTFSWDEMFKPILRYAYKQSEVKETFDEYRKHLYTFGKKQKTLRFPFRVEAYLASSKNLWFLDFSLPDKSVPWPINLNGKSLYGSALLMYAIMTTHTGTEIPRHKAGWCFEERAMVEFIDRGYTILAKDKKTEAGEIDLLIKKE